MPSPSHSGSWKLTDQMQPSRKGGSQQREGVVRIVYLSLNVRMFQFGQNTRYRLGKDGERSPKIK